MQIARAVRDAGDETRSTSGALLRELAQKIAQDRAIVYLGAGASASSSLPDWKKLLQNLKQEAEPFIRDHPHTPADKQYFDKLFDGSRNGGSKNDGSKNLEAADWLQELLGTRLDDIIQRLLRAQPDGRAFEPSLIHKCVARIPFAMALTTNYDALLEGALGEVQKAYAIYTYRETDKIVHDLNVANRFLLLKTHGNIGHRVILTNRDYADLVHGHRSFGELLKWIFSTKTCLFVGASLDDPDLLYLFHEAVSEYGERFGPHYALIPHAEAPPLRIKILLDNLKIHLIPLEETNEVTIARQVLKLDWRTVAVAHILRDLAGQEALERLERASPRLPTSDEKNFCLRAAVEKLLKQLCTLTGSFRADFCFSKDPARESSRRPAPLHVLRRTNR